MPIGVAARLPRPCSWEWASLAASTWPAAVTSTAGMVLLVYEFIHASTAGPGDGLTLASFYAATSSALFVAVELRTPQPIAPAPVP